MSEHELVKHSVKALKQIQYRTVSWEKKVRDVALEILVIVFAISLSLLLERWREHVHDEKVAKEFLVSLKEDLLSDLTEMKSDRGSYNLELTGMAYFQQSGKENKVEPDSLKKYNNRFFSTTELYPNTSRFDGLKSAGRLYIIEDQVLLRDILRFYQEALAELLYSSRLYVSWKQKDFIGYIHDHYSIEKNILGNSDDLLIVLRDRKIQNFFYTSGHVIQIIKAYDKCINLSEKIIKRIDSLYSL